MQKCKKRPKDDFSENLGTYVQFLKKWGSKCKDFEKLGGFYARFLKTRGSECNFAKCRVKNAILQGKHALR